METATIIEKIREVASSHASIEEVGIDDIKEAQLLEIEAENLIISYCEKMGYQINGFPIDKRKMDEDELDEDYFCRERFQLYLDLLSLENEDVAHLTWFFVSAFWPAQFSDKQEYLLTIKERIECGVFYDVEL
jgi:hypothetical protein